MIERLIPNAQLENTITNESLKSEEKLPRSFGSIYTPRDFAQFLTHWAIRSPEQKVLDIGIGEGVFVFTAYERLKELGAKDFDAQLQLYGTEIDAKTYHNFSKIARE